MFNDITVNDISGFVIEEKGEKMAYTKDPSALTEPTFYILLCLHESRHGYAIMQHVYELTEGRVNIGAGTLYGALNSLIEKGWIRAADVSQSSSRRKQYIVTDEGKQAFLAEVKRLNSLIADAQDVVGGINTNSMELNSMNSSDF